MRYFQNPHEFEAALTKTADAVLREKAEIWHRPKIWGNSDFLELDYVFKPKSDKRDGSMYIFEFKYSSTPTLADSTIYTQIARLSALKEANPAENLRFYLVTNGRVPLNIDKSKKFFIIDNIDSETVWADELNKLLEMNAQNFNT